METEGKNDVSFESRALNSSEKKTKLSRDDVSVLREVLHLMKHQKEHTDNYIDLLGFLLFVALYLTVLYLQADSSTAFDVKTAHFTLLPSGLTGTGGFYFNSVDDVFSWIDSSIVQTSWANAVCGNGICERPDESEGFGRFGCPSDCGVSTNLTEIVINFMTTFPSTAEANGSTWNLCLDNPALCWFSEPIPFSTTSSLETHALFIPDGNWTLLVDAPYGHVSGSVIFNGTVHWDSPYDIKHGSVLAQWSVCGTNVTGTATSICHQTAGNMSTCLFGCSLNGIIISSNATISSFFSDLHSVCDNSPVALSTFQGLDCQQIRTGVTFNSSSDFKHLFCDDSLDAVAPAPSRRRMLSFEEAEFSAFPSFKKAVRMLRSSVSAAQSSIPDPYSVQAAIAYPAVWESLGATEQQRLFNLQVATQRALYTWVNNDCLTTARKPLNSTARLSAFFCTLFGGPITLPACQYRSFFNSSHIILTTAGLQREMGLLHQRLGISQAQQEQFITVFIQALKSVTPLTETEVIAVENSLEFLNSNIVSPSSEGCPKAALTLQWSQGQTFFANLTVGDLLTFQWSDTSPHSIRQYSGIGFKRDSFIYGIGANNLFVSRITACTPKNIGNFSINAEPVPCVLASANLSAFSAFSVSTVLNKAGNFLIVDGVSPQDTYLNLTVTDIKTSKWYGSKSLSYECAPGCALGDIKSGKCHPDCDNVDCAFDGGDCACSPDENGFPACTCPAGQEKASDGSCCESYGIGQNEAFSFPVFSYGPDVSQELSRYTPGLARSRFVNFDTRILIGLVIAQTRYNSIPCSDQRFSFVYPNCSDGLSSQGFGANPVFLPRSTLYNSNYANNASLYYTSSNYTLNKQGYPYGFDAQFQANDSNFYYILDVNLNYQEASNSLNYLSEGYFFDNQTKDAKVLLVTYNGVENHFTFFSVDLTFQLGGLIAASFNIKSVDAEKYTSTMDKVRLALEIILLIAVLWNLFEEVKEIMGIYVSGESVLTYFSFWNCVDLIFLSVMLFSAGLWYYAIITRFNKLNILAHYNIYDLKALADNQQYFQLIQPGDGFRNALAAINSLKELVFFNIIYLTLNSINVIFTLLRTLKLMSFQPRLGTITRTIEAVSADLLHFFIIFFICFFGFAFFGHIAFGYSIQDLRSYASSLSICFEGILGNDRLKDSLVQLQGWQLIAGVVMWYSYIVVMVFVVFNILIAIVVDGYIQSRASFEDTPTLPAEVLWLLKNRFERLMTWSKSDHAIIKELEELLHEAERKTGLVNKLGSRRQMSVTASGALRRRNELSAFQSLMGRAKQAARAKSNGTVKHQSTRRLTLFGWKNKDLEVPPPLVATTVFNIIASRGMLSTAIEENEGDNREEKPELTQSQKDLIELSNDMTVLKELILKMKASSE